MQKKFMNQCVNNEELKKYVGHFAYKLTWVYKKDMDIEDAENELWYGLFRAVSQRYDGKEPLFLFAKRAVFSKYGNLLQRKGNATKLMNATMDKLEQTDLVADVCNHQALPDVNITLDQIKKDLESRQKESRQYHYALKQFCYLREGKSISDFCEDVGISRQYTYKLFNTITKKCGEKYYERTMPIGWV